MDSKFVDTSPDRLSLLRGSARPGRGKRRWPVRAGGWTIVAAAYLVLAFAYLWPSDLGNESTAYLVGAYMAFMIRTFIYHIGLTVTFVAVIAAWKRSWRLLGAGLPVVAIACGPSWWQYRPKSVPEVRGETITVMTANLYKWNRQTGPIVREVQQASPDVLLLQEYTPRWHEAFHAAIGGDYPYTRYVARDDSYGVAVYSRRSFVGEVVTDALYGSTRNPQIRAVIRIDGRNVTLFNVHLTLPSGRSNSVEGRRELALLLDLLKMEQSPVLLCGDFNFTDDSPNAAALHRAGFVDAHWIGGWGRGTTWPVKSVLRWVPGIRIDHVYMRGGLTCVESRTGVGEGSDHRPNIVRIGFGE